MLSGSKMLLTYNIQAQHQDAYLRFVVNEFIPTLQTLGLTNVGVWHTAYGDYPVRLLVFVAETVAMERALKADKWTELESRLKKYVTDYSCRVVPNTPHFQF